MHSSVTHKPTLAAELFGGGVGFRLDRALRRTTGVLLVGVALLLVVRRVAGKLEEAPSFGTALLAMGLAVAVAAIYRWMLPERLVQHSDSPAEIVLRYWPTAALASIAAALSIHGIDAATLVVLWLVPAASEVVWVVTRRHTPTLHEAPASQPEPGLLSPAPSDAEEEAEPASPDEPEVSQSWKRFVDDDGSDVFEGYVRADIEAGGRQASIHLAFCPPFERTPVLVCEPLDDVELRLIQAVVLPYAARIDVRLSEPAEEAFRTTIAVRAVAASVSQAGAADEAGPATL